MRVRSTGLGKTEMVAGIRRLEPVENGYIIMEMHSTEPVKWRIRVALTGADLRRLLKLTIKPATALALLGILFQGVNKKPPPDF
jgi:hypothetical protein